MQPCSLTLLPLFTFLLRPIFLTFSLLDFPPKQWLGRSSLCLDPSSSWPPVREGSQELLTVWTQLVRLACEAAGAVCVRFVFKAICNYYVHFKEEKTYNPRIQLKQTLVLFRLNRCLDYCCRYNCINNTFPSPINTVHCFKSRKSKSGYRLASF